MKAEAHPQLLDGMSGRRNPSASTANARSTSERQRVNRLFLALWSTLVGALLVVALSTASYGQVQLACRGYSPEVRDVLANPQADATMPPSPLNLEAVSAKIRYPRSASSHGQQGVVSAEILVSETGQVLQYTVDGAAAPALKQAVAEQLFELRFQPALRGGQPVRMYVSIPFAFRLL